MKEPIAILFGGVSPEHDISVITGLQVFEQINKDLFEPHVIYQNKKGVFLYLPLLKNKKDFLTTKQVEISWGRGASGGFFTFGLFKKRIYPTTAYLAFHGGGGEGGEIQGLLQSLDIPVTSPSHESSVITMNKVLMKEVLSHTNISLVPDVHIHAQEISHLTDTVDTVEKKLGLPVIVKPAHMGSSIGIVVAKTSVELEKALNATQHIDTEILVEKFIPQFEEYNISLLANDQELLMSEIEHPLKSNETLSFHDKYKKGGAKKTGGGMANLSRELPANISQELATKIQSLAKTAYRACRCTGTVRVDFMVTPENEIYLSEINSIPGSMSYYLWEASGISFQDQITRSIHEAKHVMKKRTSLRLDYDSQGVVETFLTRSARP